MEVQSLFTQGLFQSIVLIVVSILGTMQTFKQIVKFKDGRWYSLVMLFVAFSLGFVFMKDGIDWIKVSIVSWSLGQLGYDILLKSVLKFLEKITLPKE
jgi:hypothetical protein